MANAFMVSSAVLSGHLGRRDALAPAGWLFQVTTKGPPTCHGEQTQASQDLLRRTRMLDHGQNWGWQNWGWRNWQANRRQLEFSRWVEDVDQR
ncbi:MAG: hypothetical protein ABIR10_05290 [Dokdonella sp.]